MTCEKSCSLSRNPVFHKIYLKAVCTYESMPTAWELNKRIFIEYFNSAYNIAINNRAKGVDID